MSVRIVVLACRLEKASNQESGIEADMDIESRIPSDLRGRYVDFQYVGQGGMGQIVGAQDTVLDKRVAIKVLPTMTLSDTAIVRFHQEAKTVSKLNHRNIVQVLDFGFASTGEPFLVMEYVAGETLDSLIEKNKCLPLRNAVTIAIQICSGLQHAHTHKIIHRDLKPSNIMLDENKVVKILDFGLAKIMDQENIDWRLTRPGQAIGSPLYMSPEQLRGEDVDERTDIYSFGLVLFKMVTGSVPFEGENLMRILMGRLQEAPPALPQDTETPLLRQAINEIIEDALQVNREDRTNSMSEMKDALVETESIVDVKVAPVEEPKWFKATLLSKIFLLVIFTGVLFGLVVTYYLTSKKFQVPVPTSNYGPDNAPRTPDKELTITDKKRKGMPEGFEIDDEQPDLWVAESRLVDADLKRLRGSGVKKLSLELNQSITKNGIKIISGLPLTHLVLRETRLGDSIIPYLNRMKSLQSIDLRSSLVTDKGIERFEVFPEVTFLDLGFLTNVTDASIPHVKRAFPKLNFLILKDTRVTGNGLKKLLPIRLDNIIVTDLHLTDADVDTIISMQPRRITLEENPITDKGLEKLKRLPDLQHLSVENCNNVSSKKLAELRKTFPDLKIRVPTQNTDSIIGGMEELKVPEPLH